MILEWTGGAMRPPGLLLSLRAYAHPASKVPQSQKTRKWPTSPQLHTSATGVVLYPEDPFGCRRVATIASGKREGARRDELAIDRSIDLHRARQARARSVTFDLD